MLSRKEHDNLKDYIQGIDVSKIAKAFDALGEPNRCLIFRALLKNNNVNVSQLAGVVGISESLTSQHLKALLHAGLVNKEKDGKRVYYRTNEQDPLVVALGKAVET